MLKEYNLGLKVIMRLAVQIQNVPAAGSAVGLYRVDHQAIHLVEVHNKLKRSHLIAACISRKGLQLKPMFVLSM